MQLSFKNDRVLAVVAHPDDAELLCTGTLARARKDGAAIAICVLCRGDKGQPSSKVKNLAGVRRREMAASAEVLGAELFAANYPDGTLTDTPASRLKLVEVCRKFNPTLILAHAPEDYHPDHRAASALAESASWFCASLGHRTRSPAMQTQPALWWMDTLGMSSFKPGFYLDISEFVDLKKKMLARHQSQLARHEDGDFSSLSKMMHLQFRTRGMQAGVEAAEAFRAHVAFKRGRAW
jgi:LmbE family N-acetylglucosaminyl deacetylase